MIFEEDIQKEQETPLVRVIQRPELDDWLERVLIELQNDSYRPTGRGRKWRREQASKKGKK